MRAGLRGLRILVVEDEYLVATLIQDFLETAGCVVVGPIPRLAQAVEAAREETCDGAVLDINLGGSRVFSVAEILSRRRIPFVFVTGYGAEALPAEFRQHPTIRKPFKGDELLDAVSGLASPAA
jgi:DNA-binding response OmpR family regulator